MDKKRKTGTNEDRNSETDGDSEKNHESWKDRVMKEKQSQAGVKGIMKTDGMEWKPR